MSGVAPEPNSFVSIPPVKAHISPFFVSQERIFIKVESKLRQSISAIFTVALVFLFSLTAQAQSHGGEANLQLPDLTRVNFVGGISGHNLLLVGIVISVLGLVFGLAIYMNLKRLPVHSAMREISELIYETCKTYLIDPGQIHSSSRSVYRCSHRPLLRRAFGHGDSARHHHPGV